MKIYIIDRKKIYMFLLIIIFFMSVTLVKNKTAKAWKEYVPEPIRKVESSPDKMAFTCNVDWGEEYIPTMLEILKKEDIKITFFITGRWASKNPELLTKIDAQGHEIANHGYSHKLPSKISLKENIDEIKKTEDAIFQILGKKTRLYAPAAGDYNKEVLRISNELGYRVILWSVDTIDWKKGSTKDVILKRVMKKDHKGAILLMHPKEETIKALPLLIKNIKEEGINICSVSKLIEK